jgi:hypothetical protein
MRKTTTEVFILFLSHCSKEKGNGLSDLASTTSPLLAGGSCLVLHPRKKIAGYSFAIAPL